MMSAVRLVAAAVLSVLIIGCAGTTANAPTATQATTAAVSCTAPAQSLVELTEGPYYKANPPQSANLRTAGVAGTPLTLIGYVDRFLQLGDAAGDVRPPPSRNAEPNRQLDRGRTSKETAYGPQRPH